MEEEGWGGHGPTTGQSAIEEKNDDDDLYDQTCVMKSFL
jgi:hypothetical protein